MVCEEDGEEQRGVPEGWISDNAQPSMLRSNLTWPSQPVRFRRRHQRSGRALQSRCKLFKGCLNIHQKSVRHPWGGGRCVARLVVLGERTRGAPLVAAPRAAHRSRGAGSFAATGAAQIAGHGGCGAARKAHPVLEAQRCCHQACVEWATPAARASQYGSFEGVLLSQQAWQTLDGVARRYICEARTSASVRH